MTIKIPELWLKYAFDDLKSAQVLLKEKIFNMVCFHSQQVAEKLFKSLIASYNQEIPSLFNQIYSVFLDRGLAGILHKVCTKRF